MKNLQGDIVAILDRDKNVVVSYVYDAWGRPISCSGTMASTLGKLNPFRYRGYVFDEETELYYLRSRYYNFSMCRFLIADMYISTDSGLFDHEMYLYCKNGIALNGGFGVGIDMHFKQTVTDTLWSTEQEKED